MAISEDMASEAAQALTWVTALRQTAEGWVHTERIIVELKTALKAGDEDAAREAVFELDLISRRVQEKLGEEPNLTEMPAKQRDRANEMVHELSPNGDAPTPKER
jgi:hypothetical protein